MSGRQLNGVLPLHDISDTEKFCARILDNHLRRTRATLNAADSEDAVQYLIVVCWQLSERYEPARSSSFSKYAYSILTRRIVDWYRSRFAPRDPTGEAWYQRMYPGGKPTDSDSLHAFHFPESLDTDDHGHVAASDPLERDPLEFAVRARRLDTGLDCDPGLHDALGRGHSYRDGRLDVRGQAADGGVTRRDRKAA